MNEIIDPFINNIGVQVESVDNYGSTSLQQLSDLKIGAGAIAMKADRSGLWLGADKFVDAPFSVDMNGNIIATSLGLGNYLTKAGTAQNLSGSINVGSSAVLIDGVNGRILIKDGTNNRIVMGNI